MTSIPIAEGLFRESDDGAYLIGGRCRSCDAVSFPTRTTCGRCQHDDIAEERLPRTGTVWTWTSQSFLPKAPYIGPGTDSDFEGFVVGYVDLPGACIVQARLDVPVAEASERVAIGTTVDLVTLPFCTNSDGATVTTYAFRPSSQEGATA
ncbi:Zn-ribbon domain-containing OB-fold protein [Rhodococcus artemisiae]|uniref:OB-fold domain-containing protein n=1 Tax=Rhodococcus artemisiae TaxID=714159 RepID=A0ABU7LEX7_9NOCA|nr:OB-fold domain-containing protein [Rhodococcus artemisiae]MEE2060093.1 OB-fold domain-containing protein [Rhodococcus artemisiae]